MCTSDISYTISQSLLSCLNDYTTDQRGDVGSLVRVAAINVVHAAWHLHLLPALNLKQELLAKICGLAVEKLDKVRYHAWRCLQDSWALFEQSQVPTMHVQALYNRVRDETNLESSISDIGQVSSVEYYLQVVGLCSIDWVKTSLLEGLVTSMGAGSEPILCASRAALVAYLEDVDRSELMTFWQSVSGILRNNTSNERLVVPVLEVLAFLLETEIFDQLGDDFLG